MRDHHEEEGTVMAQEVPRTFITDQRQADRAKPKPSPEERLFHLAPHHVQTLRDVAQGVEESDVGVCCSYLVDSLSGEGADYDECALNRVERYVESALTFDALGEIFGRTVVVTWRSKLHRCRRALTRLHEKGDHDAVAVLMVAYGHPDALTRQIPELRAFGMLGPLVRYTEATEKRRQELVSREVARLSRHEAIVSYHTAKERAAWADRVITSGDALRAATDLFSEPMPIQGTTPHVIHEAKKAARKEREEAHKARRAAFLTEARLEAAKMLSRAEERYHHAWLAVAS